MDKSTRSKILENYSRRIFRNVSRNGDWVNFSCPIAQWSPDHKFKADNSPSAGAIVASQGNVIWKCFTCKGQGPITNLLRYLETKQKVSYAEIIAYFEQESELPEYEDRFVTASKLVCEPLEYADLFDPAEKSAEAMRYLTDRNISLVTARKLGLCVDTDNHRIVFPVKDRQGRVYGFTGRTMLKDGTPKIKDYYFPKSQFILGVEHWNPDYPVIIVEGLFAFARLHELSKGRYFPYNIGAIMGSSASPEQIRILVEFGNPVILMLDNDPAGKAGMFGRTPHPDWSKDKRQLEKEKGLTWQLKDSIPTMFVKWPTHTILLDGQEVTVEKDDPDLLTFEELSDMLLKLKLVL